MEKFVLNLVFLIYVTHNGFSRAISYPEGVTIMNQNYHDQQRLHVHYTFSVQRSLGVVLQHYQKPSLQQLQEGFDIQIGVQWNELLYRRNTKTSQTNLYLKSLYLLNQWGGSLGIAGDSETRRLFASYQWVHDYNRKTRGLELHQTGRIGVAPYIAEFNSIHLWLMLQARQYIYSSEHGQHIDWTPLIRIFKGPLLLEIGSNFQNTFLFNIVCRL